MSAEYTATGQTSRSPGLLGFPLIKAPSLLLASAPVFKLQCLYEPDAHWIGEKLWEASSKEALCKRSRSHKWQPN